MNLNRLLLITFSMMSFVVDAQTTQKKNQLEFSIGYNSGAIKNLEFAPVARYDFNDILYKLNYERTSKRQNIFEIELDFLNRTALKTNKIPSLNAAYLRGDISFSYLRRLYHKNAFTIHLGLQSQSNISLLFNRTDYFTLSQEFGIASRIGYQLNEKQYLSSKLTIPFILFRGPSNGATISSFNRYQSILLNLKYGYVLSEYFDLKVTYDFMYKRLKIPSAYRELQHQLNLGIIFKF